MLAILQGPVLMPGEAAPVIVLVTLAALAAATLILFPLVRALARRLEGKAEDSQLRGELEDLRQRVGELEGQHGRVLELEERLDFAERLLTQDGQLHRPGQLPRGEA